MRQSKRRIVLAGVLSLFSIGVLIDLARPPDRQGTALLLLQAIDGYQTHVSGQMERAGVRCRFEPTCSHYAEAVIRRDGALVGCWRALGRLARCGPWTPLGTPDPP